MSSPRAPQRVNPRTLLKKLGDNIFLELAHNDTFCCVIEDPEKFMAVLTGTVRTPIKGLIDSEEFDR